VLAQHRQVYRDMTGPSPPCGPRHLGRAPAEVHRLVRNLYNALADVESESAKADDLRGPAAATIAERAAGLAA
jgi:hypothetical protein